MKLKVIFCNMLWIMHERVIITPRVLHYCVLITMCSPYLMGTTVINITVRVGGEGLAYVHRPRTLDYIAHLSGPKACIICASCCSMQCNCAEDLHYSAFQYFLCKRHHLWTDLLSCHKLQVTHLHSLCIQHSHGKKNQFPCNTLG